MNLGISDKFGFVDYDHLTFPSTMRVDWIRVYQDPQNKNIGCDPPDFPTAAYIETYVPVPITDILFLNVDVIGTRRPMQTRI